MFPHYIAKNLLFAEITHRFVYIEDAPYLIFLLTIPLLLWLISHFFFKGKLSILAPIILLLSPWFWYLAAAHSFYIFLFSSMLAFFYGILLIQSGRIFSGKGIALMSLLICIYSSSIFLILIPVILLVIILTGLIPFKDLKLIIFSTVLMISSIFFISVHNDVSPKTIILREFEVFSDPGLINTVNRYRGYAEKNGLANASRLSQNKYTFWSGFLLSKYLNQMIPLTFFTPQNKLLGFSFSPPILLGLIIPCIFGLYLLLHNSKIRKLIFASTLLVLPSVLAKPPVSLNRLILFSPVVIFLISYGLIKLYERRKNQTAKIFLIFTAVLILIQSFVILGDIKEREIRRSDAYLGKVFQIPEP